MIDPSLQGLATKQAAIAACFSGVVGAKFVRYESAEIQLVDGQWAPYPDLPIRLSTDRSVIVSVCWSRFDELWLSNDTSLPFQPDEETTRWIPNAISVVNEGLGRRICSVHLGRDEMTIGSRRFDIWTRLVIALEDRWLEIFNGLDENGYQLHASMPAGEFIQCV